MIVGVLKWKSFARAKASQKFKNIIRGKFPKAKLSETGRYGQKRLTKDCKANIPRAQLHSPRRELREWNRSCKRRFATVTFRPLKKSGREVLPMRPTKQSLCAVTAIF